MKFYITSPLYYVNDKPHIGHSYTNIACDVVARYHRLKGEEVFFLTGTDEHGQKVQRQAQSSGLETQEFVDRVSLRFRELWNGLNISHDDFIRTTQPRHIKAVQRVLQTLYDRGDIYQDKYEGWYCTPCETFWPELQVAGQNCPDCGRNLEQIKEQNYFFKLSRYQNWLIDHIEKNNDFIQPVSRRNETLGFLKNQPLSDLCISRPKARLSWGIELPFDRDYVTYVWFDALINYISGCGYPDDMDRFKNLWPADFHVIGKDILRPHTIYWPIMLHSLGFEPPKCVFAHGWWKVQDEKMSKSKGNIVDPVEVTDKYGTDAYRYFLLREVSFGLDGAYSEQALIGRLNSDLANDLGNLLHRTLTMVEKYFDGLVPAPEDSIQQPLDKELASKAVSLSELLEKCMQNLDFAGALSAIWELINKANKYIEEMAPWKLAKKDQTRLKVVTYHLLETLRIITIALQPFIPQTTKNMAKQLGIEENIENYQLKDMEQWGLLRPGKRISKDKPLFPRVKV